MERKIFQSSGELPKNLGMASAGAPWSTSRLPYGVAVLHSLNKAIRLCVEIRIPLCIPFRRNTAFGSPLKGES